MNQYPSNPSRFCDQCGNKLQEGQNFCNNCGTALDTLNTHPITAEHSDSSYPVSPRAGKLWSKLTAHWKWILVLLFLLSIIAIFTIVNCTPNEPPKNFSETIFNISELEQSFLDRGEMLRGSLGNYGYSRKDLAFLLAMLSAVVGVNWPNTDR